MILRGIPLSSIRVIERDKAIDKFNMMSDERIEVLTDDKIELNLDWQIPQDIKSIDLDKFIADMSKSESEVGEIRLQNEYQEFKRRGMTMFLRTIIFIVREFRSKNVVWGVGRGSSCASYLLFRLGLHSVNPLKYKIPYTEFFHD